MQFVYLFAAVDAVLTEDRSAPCGHPNSSQRVAVNLVLLNHSLAFLMLKLSTGPLIIGPHFSPC